MDIETLKIAAGYGLGGVISVLLIVLLSRVLAKIGERMIDRLDGLGQQWRATGERIVDRIDEHSKADVAALTAIASRLDALSIRLDGIDRRTERALDIVESMHDRMRDGDPTPTPVRRPPQRVPAIGTGTVPRPREDLLYEETEEGDLRIVHVSSLEAKKR